jgi:hypothetical protein
MWSGLQGETGEQLEVTRKDGSADRDLFGVAAAPDIARTRTSAATTEGVVNGRREKSRPTFDSLYSRFPPSTTSTTSKGTHRAVEHAHEPFATPCTVSTVLLDALDNELMRRAERVREGDRSSGRMLRRAGGIGEVGTAAAEEVYALTREQHQFLVSGRRKGSSTPLPLAQ